MPELSNLDILAQARKEFTIADKGERQQREEYSRCMRFIALEHWTPEQKEARGKERPSIVIDHLGPIADQIINDWIRDRIGAKVVPADALASKSTAKVLSGWIRNVEYLSNAQYAYNCAMKNMVRGGVGYIGITTERRPGTFQGEQ